MNIFDKIFESNNYKYCISCGNKHKDSDMSVCCGLAGICNKCCSKIIPTRQGSSFEALAPVSYLLSSVEYSGSVVNIMQSFKFRSNFKNGDIICKILCDFLASYPMLSDFDFVIPVPLSQERLNERGFNQSEIIAKEVSKAIGVTLRTDILKRIRHTKRQSSFPALLRYSNVDGAFKSFSYLSGKSIILIDDIYTTGSTLSACAKALKESHAKEIIGITFARTIKKDLPMILRPPSKSLKDCKTLKDFKWHFQNKQ